MTSPGNYETCPLCGFWAPAGHKHADTMPRPVSGRERIAAMREQARENDRRRNFRYGLAALAAVAVIIAAVIIIVVH